jgi:hypothetical protein
VVTTSPTVENIGLDCTSATHSSWGTVDIVFFWKSTRCSFNCLPASLDLWIQLLARSSKVWGLAPWFDHPSCKFKYHCLNRDRTTCRITLNCTKPLFRKWTPVGVRPKY